MTPADFGVWDFLKDCPNARVDQLRQFFKRNYMHVSTSVLLARAICGHPESVFSEILSISRSNIPEVAIVGESARCNFPKITIKFLVESFSSDYHGVFYFIDKILSHPDISIEDLMVVKSSYMKLLTKRHKKNADLEEVMDSSQRIIKDKINAAIAKQFYSN
jgi:hypothetical protein